MQKKEVDIESMYQKLRQYAFNLKYGKFYSIPNNSIDDIVQDAFLSYYKSDRRGARSELSFLKIHLYRAFITKIDPSRKSSRDNALITFTPILLDKEENTSHYRLDWDKEVMYNILTIRQKEVLFFLLKGYTQSEIAHKLGISKQAVAASMEHILKKLKVLFS